MRFRYVVYGDVYTEEDNDVEKARAEAQAMVEELTAEIPNCYTSSLLTMTELKEGK